MKLIFHSKLAKKDVINNVEIISKLKYMCHHDNHTDSKNVLRHHKRQSWIRQTAWHSIDPTFTFKNSQGPIIHHIVSVFLQQISIFVLKYASTIRSSFSTTLDFLASLVLFFHHSSTWSSTVTSLLLLAPSLYTWCTPTIHGTDCEGSGYCAPQLSRSPSSARSARPSRPSPRCTRWPRHDKQQPCLNSVARFKQCSTV